MYIDVKAKQSRCFSSDENRKSYDTSETEKCTDRKRVRQKSHRHKKNVWREWETEYYIEKAGWVASVQRRGFSPALISIVVVKPQEEKNWNFKRHVPMVTRCPPCGVERIGSRSPGALGLFWDTESTVPGRSSPRPRTASPYPTMWSLPSVVSVHILCVCSIIFGLFRSWFRLWEIFFVFFSWPRDTQNPPNIIRERTVGGRADIRSAEQCREMVPVTRVAPGDIANFRAVNPGETMWR